MFHFRKWGELGGSGAILSNALDMTRWMRFLLNKGELDGKLIMNSKTVDDIFKARNYPISRTTTFIRPNTPITISNDLYSLGWRKGYLRGKYRKNFLLHYVTRYLSLGSNCYCLFAYA